VSKRLAENLKPGSVYLNCPVNGIIHTSTGATVETLPGEVFRARKVLISVPTPLYRHIRFSPPLPADKQEYVESVHLGPYCKCILIYSRPWWREVGLNGSFIDLSGPVVFSRDVSSDADGMYAISCLIGGRYAHEWSRLPLSQREKAVKDQLATMVGPEHGGKIYDAIQTIQKAWAKEPFIEGVPCPMPAPGGIWPRLGNALRRPVGSLHFIGTETAIEWKGYMEGAVRAGERGAAEVVTDLRAADGGRQSWQL
jgi:monoamine oxidase